MRNSDSPQISVVIPVRDERIVLEQCLSALAKQTAARDQYEVIVVDDGSVDGSGDVAAAWGARVIGQQKQGAAAARNHGVAEALGEIVLFTDADCVSERDWIERLSAPIRTAGVDGTVGRCVSRQQHWVARLIQLELDERYARMGHHERIDFLNTGNCAFRRALLGPRPFDERFRWLEDVDLSFRLAQNGNRMVFVSDARVIHSQPESLWKYLRRKFHYASYAPSIYRRYPGKVISDSRTPVNRKLQLVCLGLAGVLLPFAFIYGAARWMLLAFVVASLLCAAPVIVRAFGESFLLGLVSPLFVFMGNAAFLLGALRGFLRRGVSSEPTR